MREKKRPDECQLGHANNWSCTYVHFLFFLKAEVANLSALNLTTDVEPGLF